MAAVQFPVPALRVLVLHGLSLLDWSSETFAEKATNSRKEICGECGNEYIRGCYFTNWAQYRQGRAKYFPETYIPGLCTHIFYAFGYINDDYTVRAFDLSDLPTEWAGIGMFARVNNLKKVDEKLKTILSFGGWSFGTRIFKEMSSSADSRSVFVKSAITFVRKYGFDGIDIDWEYPNGLIDAVSFTALMKDLWEAAKLETKETNRERLLIVAAVPASKEKIEGGYNIAEFAPYVDFILLMSYDFHGAWEHVTGFNSPLYSAATGDQWDVDQAAAYWEKGGMPKEKIVVGVATYGRGWTLDYASVANGVGAPGRTSRITEFVGEPGVAAYFEICEWLADKAIRRWDSTGKVPYLIYEDQWYSYEDVDSIRAKVEWLKKKRYGGMFVWTLDFDDFNGNCTSGDVEFPLTSTITKMLDGLKPLQEDDDITAQISSLTTSATITSISNIKTDDLCSKHPDGYHAHPSSCFKFLLCLNSSSFVFDCPQDLLFDSQRRHCTFPRNEKSAEQCSIGNSDTFVVSSNSVSRAASFTLNLIILTVLCFCAWY